MERKRQMARRGWWAVACALLASGCASPRSASDAVVGRGTYGDMGLSGVHPSLAPARSTEVVDTFTLERAPWLGVADNLWLVDRGAFLVLDEDRGLCQFSVDGDRILRDWCQAAWASPGVQEQVALDDAWLLGIRDEPDLQAHDLALLDRSDGSLRWSQALPSAARHIVASADVVVVDGSGLLQGFDRATGEPLWTTAVDLDSEPPAIQGPWVVSQDGDGAIHVSSARTGERRRSCKLPNPSLGRPVFDRGEILAAVAVGFETHLVACDPATGGILWESGSVGPLGDHPVLWAWEGVVVAVGEDRMVTVPRANRTMPLAEHTWPGGVPGARWPTDDRIWLAADGTWQSWDLHLKRRPALDRPLSPGVAFLGDDFTIRLEDENSTCGDLYTGGCTFTGWLELRLLR